MCRIKISVSAPTTAYLYIVNTWCFQSHIVLNIIVAQKWYVAFSSMICIRTDKLDSEPALNSHSYQVPAEIYVIYGLSEG